MKLKRKIIAYGILLMFLILIIGVSCKNLNNVNTIQTNANVKLSTSKFAWGFKRGENHEQPILDSKPLKILNQYDGIAMGNKDSKKIYLTFDAGFEGGYTEKILQTLEKTNVKATFFITAHYLNTAEDLVKKMVEGGHDVRKSYCQS